MQNKKRKKRTINKSGKLRLSIFKSNKNILAQIIDDNKGETLVSSSSLKIKDGGNLKGAKVVGEDLANKAKEKKINGIFFDRGRNTYKGRVKILIETAKEKGLQI
jgi:large subunit ribosomal protein L18